MFGRFNGPFPEGKYLIQWSSDTNSHVLVSTSAVSNAPPAMALPEVRNDKQVVRIVSYLRQYDTP